MDFETGLCECFSDIETCLISFCFPCIQFGRNAHPLLPCSGCMGCACFHALCSSTPLGVCITLQNRILIRNELNYRRDDIMDCVKTVCCMPCTLAQEGRELKAKGIHYHN